MKNWGSMYASFPKKKIHGGSERFRRRNVKKEPSKKEKKRALENKKEPLKITIDCNVKAYSMLQIYSVGCEN